MRTTLKRLLRRLGLLEPVQRGRQRLDRSLPRQLQRRLRSRARQRSRRRLYRRFVPPGALVFDIGANLGNWTHDFLVLGARVIVVEPHPVCVARLTERFGGDPRVTLVALGVAATPGRRSLLLSDDIQTSSMSAEWVEAIQVRLSTHRWKASLEVEVTTLDALVEEYGTPAFCKIDVEGYELEVLRGLTRPLPALSFELTGERLEPAVACVERLVELGEYEFNFGMGHPGTLELSRWSSAEELVRRLREVEGWSRSGDVYARSRR